MSRKSDKRDRLIDAAKNLIYQQDFNITTLSELANEADVPPGNIDYYFKEKADIGVAVLNSIAAEQKIFFEHLNKEPSLKTRLYYFLEHTKQDRKLITVGFIEEATDLSLDLMYKVQGAFLLAYMFKDSNFIARQIKLLQDFVQKRIPEKVNEFAESV